jgi:CRISPR-associated protein Cas1
LFNNIIAFIQLRKLTLNIGFLHRNYSNQPSLALDLMEPFRATIVDSLVIKLALSNALSLSDFTIKNDACFLSAKAKKLFITALENKLSQQICYSSLKITTDYRRIMDLQTLLLKQSLLNPDIKFKPFRIR